MTKNQLYPIGEISQWPIGFWDGYFHRIAWFTPHKLRQSAGNSHIKWLIMKILVRNLDRDTIEHDVRKLFLGYGRVVECTLVLDQETGKSKGFAFVDMPNEDEAKVAIKELNLTMFKGSKIRVKFAGH